MYDIMSEGPIGDYSSEQEGQGLCPNKPYISVGGDC